ncbi:hypothetical protein G7Y89_g5859 [Cudoniella acicularis]|uniref:Zn(2)-C6 fungal-type domain-containing protein n=1 Tax=Cudoniella acicularis TaxID=354080 RepID=A0A8H4RPX9_9HELO|nr:hypothetical protein G7Y89_g5859 [Cudoniella acicularis]
MGEAASDEVHTILLIRFTRCRAGLRLAFAASPIAKKRCTVNRAAPPHFAHAILGCGTNITLTVGDTPAVDNSDLPPICSSPDRESSDEKDSPSAPRALQSIRFQNLHTLSPGSQKDPTATIPSPHSIAAILSPSVPPEESTNGTSRSSTPKRTHAEAFSADQAYLHPASPSQHHAGIASVGEPSPGTRGPDDGSSGGMRGGLEEKKPPKMVRSSIACSRCRRSKVKCVNTGINSTCKACASSNRECTYPGPNSVVTPKRNDATAGIKQEDGESKKRIKKVEDAGRRNSQKTAEDILDSPILTRKMWDEVYDIFKLHFSTEMPFLHPPTFKNRMRQASYPRDPSAPASDLQDGKLLLLGVLTLTARFHPELVAHYSPSSNPLAASEYYATALAASFDRSNRNNLNPSLEVVQAYLMLALYEWGQTKGAMAFQDVGSAIRVAQLLELSYEDEPKPLVPTNQVVDPRNHPATNNILSPGEELTMKEVRRRTWWSCFIMDRMISAGKRRETMIVTDRLRVQLPCSDDQFLFKHDVKTAILNSNWQREIKPGEKINDDGVLGWYIRLVEIFGRFSEWSYAGGRRTESLPPWDKSTEFYKLRHELENFQRALPPNLAFNEANLSAHIEKRNATAYASMHTLYSLCLIMLHREYIPFIPLRCQKPSGPLDEPTFPPDKFDVPKGFWEESAENIFRAARNIIDIVRTCQEDNALPESPQIGFAIWQAAFVCVYAIHFNHMDTGHYLHSSELEQSPDFRNRGYFNITSKLLQDMVSRLRMAKGYQISIQKMHDYFEKVRGEYYRYVSDNVQPSFSGGGLDQYKKLEKELKEFGSLDNDKTIHSDESDTAEQARSRASTNDIGAGSSVNGEPMQGVESVLAPRPNGTASWAAVNAQNTPDMEERTKYNSQYPYGIPAQYSPNQSNPPSLGPNSGVPNSGPNSSYTLAQPHHSHYHNTVMPPVSTYPSMAQHTQPQPAMAPPTAHHPPDAWSQEQKDRWMLSTEGLDWNAEISTLAQIHGLDMWSRQQNYLQAPWNEGYT